MKTKLSFLLLLLLSLPSAPAASLDITNIRVPLIGVSEPAPTSMVKVANSLIILSNSAASGGTGGSINATNPIFYESIRLATGTNWGITNLIWDPDHTNTAGTNTPPYPPIYIPGPGGTLTNDDGDIIIIGPNTPPTGVPVGMSNIVWLTNAGTAAVNGPYQRVSFNGWTYGPSECWLQLPLNTYPKFQIFVWPSGYAEVGSVTNSGSVGHLGHHIRSATIQYDCAVNVINGQPLAARADRPSAIIDGPTTNGFSAVSGGYRRIGTPDVSYVRSGTNVTARLTGFDGMTHTTAHTITFAGAFANGDDSFSDSQAFAGYTSPNPPYSYTPTATTPKDGAGPYYIRSDFYCNSSSWTTSGGIGAASAPTQRFFYAQTNFCSGTPPSSSVPNMPTNSGPTRVQVSTNNAASFSNGYLVWHARSGDCTYLLPSPLWISGCMSADRTGYGPNWITVDSIGTARLILIGITVDVAPQSDSNAWRPCRENSSITYE